MKSTLAVLPPIFLAQITAVTNLARMYVSELHIRSPPHWLTAIPSPQASPKEKLIYQLKRLLRKIYPTINAAYYFSTLAFNLAYLFDKSHYHTPFHFLINVRMRRLNEADHVRTSNPLYWANN